MKLKVPFRTFALSEGGNARVGEEHAHHIELDRVQRTEIVKEIVPNLLAMNNAFLRDNKVPLWADENFIKSGKVFSGSSKHFIDLSIPDEEFAKHKPTVGDIDLQIDKNMSDMVSRWLTPGKKFGTMTYLGRVESKVGTQIITLMHFPKWDINVQMDLEMVDFSKHGLPTDWASFSHSADWDDITLGIKGVFHKYLLGAIDFAFMREMTILSGVKLNVKKQRVHPFAFSVSYGLRPKYRHATDAEKAQAGVEGEAWVEMKPADSKYVFELHEIFLALFRHEPKGNDLKKMESFNGLLDLICSEFDRAQVELIFDEFVGGRCWGKGAQQLYRGEPMKDLNAKSAATNYFIARAGLQSKQKEVDALIDEFYKNYK